MTVDGIGGMSAAASLGNGPHAPRVQGRQPPAATPAQRAAGAAQSAQQLSPEEQQQLQRLRATDQKVRQHEQAHLANAAGLSVGGANFQYVRGPDSRQYAVAGEVRIDVSAAATPEQTIDKARRIRAAALAPADPSSADRAVAAAAALMEAQARAEVNRARQTTADGPPPGQAQQAGTESWSSRVALAAYRAQDDGNARPPSLSLFAY